MLKNTEGDVSSYVVLFRICLYKTVMKAIVMNFIMVTVAVKKKYFNYSVPPAKNHYLFFPFSMKLLRCLVKTNNKITRMTTFISAKLFEIILKIFRKFYRKSREKNHATFHQI